MQYRREAGLHQKTAFILLDILVLFFMQINFLALCISCLRNQIFSNLFAIFVNWPQSRNSRSAKHSSDPSSINCIQCWLNSVKKRFNLLMGDENFRKYFDFVAILQLHSYQRFDRTAFSFLGHCVRQPLLYTIILKLS